MTAKEYLQQTFFLNQRINSKIEQLESLNALATKATSVLSDMPKSPKQKNSFEETILKIIHLQEEINQEIDALVDLKLDIHNLIGSLEDEEEQTVLEKRYLNFMPWEQIAVTLNYSLPYCYKVHSRALNKIQVKLKSV